MAHGHDDSTINIVLVLLLLLLLFLLQVYICTEQLLYLCLSPFTYTNYYYYYSLLRTKQHN